MQNSHLQLKPMKAMSLDLSSQGPFTHKAVMFVRNYDFLEH